MSRLSVLPTLDLAALPIPYDTPQEAVQDHRNRLIGRDEDTADLLRALRDPAVRLLTVTGPAGVGKSALVRRALAACPAPLGEELTVTVELASSSRRADTWERVVTALGRQPGNGAPGDGAPPARRLAEVRAAIAGRRVLVVLDNADLAVHHLATDLTALLHGSPELRVVLSSRTALDVTAELLFPVTPLTTATGRDAGCGTDSARLFLERVRAHYRRSVLADADERTIDEICALLDGVPLAIEVTAGAVGALSPRALLERLRRGEQPLGRRPLDVAARHRSLDACLSWAEPALAPPERTLLRRLSVCEMPVDVHTAERLGGIGAAQAANRLDTLVHRSLLLSVRRPADAEPGFRMLRATRAHYRARLAEDPAEERATRALHARHIGERAEALGSALCEPGLSRADWRRRLAEFRELLADIRAALEWLRLTDRPAEAARLLLALAPAWSAEGLTAEAGRLLGRAADALETEEAEAADAALRGRALDTAARWAAMAGAVEEAQALLLRAEAHHRAHGDRAGLARVALLRGEVFHRTGAGASAERQVGSAISELEVLGCAADALAARVLLARLRAERGDGEAEEVVRRSLPHADPALRARALTAQAQVRLALGRPAEAHLAVREALRLLTAYGSAPECAVAALETAAAVCGRHPDTESAREGVLGAARALRAAYGLGTAAEPDRGAEPGEDAHEPGRARDEGGAEAPALAGDAECRERALLDALTAAAALPAPEPAAPEAPVARLKGLTPRQQQIADLVAEGMTNRQMARELGLSEWTVVNHLRQVMSKLNCPSRVHVARLVQQRDIG
ncbi:LuxR C-terminal-related transcriptional regulator [Streptomyces sp. JJ38]|uniref:LuxR C-terminal-related transcriptional regulator n=1 Tax=Streptomyces sp. JJ38 TaxID=2738128 RepID=UPI001C55E26B|nr:LuxR C-terminal-related transcriptional regulator [Streptomyces sp. JJ38]MBW1598571.1 AAA family ATPase [Streptomyces sp. JJ38]